MPKVHCKLSLRTGLLAYALVTLVAFAVMASLVTALSRRVDAQNSQVPPPPTPPPSSSTGPTYNTNSDPNGRSSSSDQSQDQSQDQPATTLKVNVEVVQLFFNVKDKHGALIPHLNKENFDIFEDGKQQTIKYFKAESDLPLTLGILIDSSGSQTRVLDMEKEVGGSFLESILRPKDEAFVISFDVDITLLQDFTTSVSRLRHALNEARINTGGVSCAGGPIGPQGPIPCSSTGPRGTALYDAVYLASHDEFSHEVGRKAMILLTDGEDEGSRLKIKDAVEAAQKADAICYVLLIADRGFYGFGGYHGDSEMKKLTQETGGRVIEVGNKIDKLRQAFDQIAQELRSQYNIGYTPTNAARDGSFRKVEIKPKDGDYKVQARSGYYAVARQEDQ
ncbi:MAG TPA: VWA domain-containing protein [Terriglobales bacterium]|jgi:VWFA-related protein|nr:VWA domain-containing protein [Terriglobales bacterium]